VVEAEDITTQIMKVELVDQELLSLEFLPFPQIQILKLKVLARYQLIPIKLKLITTQLLSGT
jgi:hypothetical protein